MTTNDIKFAKPEDIPQIVSFAYNTHKDVELNDLAEPSLAKITTTITDAVVQGVVLVKRNEKDPKHIDGVMALKYVSPWWSEEVLLKQLFFYVKPEARGSKVFDNLLQGASEYGIINQLPLGQEIVGVKHAAKGALLKRKGYKKIGESYIKRNS